MRTLPDVRTQLGPFISEARSLIRSSFFVITFRLFGSLALPAFLFLSLCYVHLLHEAQIGCLNGGAARVV